MRKTSEAESSTGSGEATAAVEREGTASIFAFWKSGFGTLTRTTGGEADFAEETEEVKEVFSSTTGRRREAERGGSVVGSDACESLCDDGAAGDKRVETSAGGAEGAEADDDNRGEEEEGGDAEVDEEIFTRGGNGPPPEKEESLPAFFFTTWDRHIELQAAQR